MTDMGVDNLWQLLSPSGRHITIETLAGQVLAVDASIWLMQLVKAMRDKEGNMVPNAHLTGVFNRVMKMIYHKIKPVFVFDGGAPILKRRTLMKRQQNAAKQGAKLQQAARKLLSIQLLKANLTSASDINHDVTSAGGTSLVRQGNKRKRVSVEEGKNVRARNTASISSARGFVMPVTAAPTNIEQDIIDVDEEQDGWVCDCCGTMNSTEVSTCTMCETERKPQHPATSITVSSSIQYANTIDINGQWDCPVCTLQNDKYVIQCEACGESNAVSTNNEQDLMTHGDEAGEAEEYDDDCDEEWEALRRKVV